MMFVCHLPKSKFYKRSPTVSVDMKFQLASVVSGNLFPLQIKGVCSITAVDRAAL